MVQYCTFVFYQNEYKGKAVSEEEFSSYLIHAQSVVDRLTFNRLKYMEVIPDEAKFACCAAVEVYAKAQQNDGEMLASETVGKHSVTYVNTGKTLESKMLDEAKNFLHGSKLLYRGVF